MSVNSVKQGLKRDRHTTDGATIKAKRYYVKSILVLFLFFCPVVIKLCGCLFFEKLRRTERERERERERDRETEIKR